MLEETIGSRKRHISYDNLSYLPSVCWELSKFQNSTIKNLISLELKIHLLTNSLTILQGVGREIGSRTRHISYDNLSYLPSVCWELSKFQNSTIKNLISLELKIHLLTNSLTILQGVGREIGSRTRHISYHKKALLTIGVSGAE